MFISKCFAAELTSSRLREAIEVAASSLVNYSYLDKFGRNWPSWRDLDPASHEQGTRTAWCYGAPGVCSALWLAGSYCSNANWREIAVDGMKSVQERTLGTAWAEGPTFCHGTAGVLHIANLFEVNAGGFVALQRFLLRTLIEQFEPSSTFGYRDVGPKEVRFDRAGLLEGVAGILMVLTSLDRPDTEPDWDEPFALR